MSGARVIRLDLAYDGTDYAGFGVQPGRRTVQEVLERAFEDSTGERVRVTVAGRTDAGVHASGQVVSLRTDSKLSPEALVRAINARLSDDVQVTKASEASEWFDARRSATRRSYRYSIWNAPAPDLWRRRHTLHVRAELDVARMSAATEAILGEHDFRAFAARIARDPPGSTRRTVYEAGWTRCESDVWFEISADGFLRHMVRGIVGTLLWIGRGRLEVKDMALILASTDRRAAGPNAPAHGLMLTRVDYPQLPTGDERSFK